MIQPQLPHSKSISSLFRIGLSPVSSRLRAALDKLWYMYADRRSRSPAADNLDLAAELLGTLTHSCEPVGALLVLHMLEALPVIADAQHDLARHLPQGQTDHPCAGMLHDIRHRLLNNQEQLMLNRFGQLTLQLELLHPFEPVLAAVIREPLLQCFEQITPLKLYRTQLCDRALICFCAIWDMLIS